MSLGEGMLDPPALGSAAGVMSPLSISMSAPVMQQVQEAQAIDEEPGVGYHLHWPYLQYPLPAANPPNLAWHALIG